MNQKNTNKLMIKSYDEPLCYHNLGIISESRHQTVLENAPALSRENNTEYINKYNESVDKFQKLQPTSNYNNFGLFSGSLFDIW